MTGRDRVSESLIASVVAVYPGPRSGCRPTRERASHRPGPEYQEAARNPARRCALRVAQRASSLRVRAAPEKGVVGSERRPRGDSDAFRAAIATIASAAAADSGVAELLGTQRRPRLRARSEGACERHCDRSRCRPQLTCGCSRRHDTVAVRVQVTRTPLSACMRLVSRDGRSGYPAACRCRRSLCGPKAAICLLKL